MRATHLLLIAIGLLSAGATHLAQRAVDRARFDRRLEAQTLYQPNGAAIRVASLGYHGQVADLMWVRAVLQFADAYEQPRPEDVAWLRATLDALAVLDPTWRTLYFYGGGFLRVMGDIDGSDRVYAAGSRALPADPFFPFSLGMNAYLYRSDKAGAVRWLKVAAEKPGAPGWYGAAAAAFMEGQGERQAALHYLQDQISKETRPELIKPLRRKYDALLHDALADQLEALRQRFEAERGRPLARPEELGALPPDPLGGQWIVAADGQIRSAVRDAELQRAAAMKERGLILLPLDQRSFPVSSGL